jgi:hypothetical protein
LVFVEIEAQGAAFFSLRQQCNTDQGMKNDTISADSIKGPASALGLLFLASFPSCRGRSSKRRIHPKLCHGDSPAGFKSRQKRSMSVGVIYISGLEASDVVRDRMKTSLWHRWRPPGGGC